VVPHTNSVAVTNLTVRVPQQLWLLVLALVVDCRAHITDCCIRNTPLCVTFYTLERVCIVLANVCTLLFTSQWT
jgi:hypothetical protein